MINFVDNYCAFPTVMRRPMWRIWHNLLIRFDEEETVNFMNYGFASLNGDKEIELLDEDKNNRYCIQLYDHLARKVEIGHKKVLEVGSGRGGGAYYISRYYNPSEYTGIDISSKVIDFCNRFYHAPNLSFLEGRAEDLPCSSDYYDVVVNVESARCYSNIPEFFREVHRVLSSEGHFLFADMIEKEEVGTIRSQLLENGFNIVNEKNITKNVAKGLELDSERREKIIDARIPKFLRNNFRKFAGTKGSSRFDSFRNGKFEYWSFVLKKK